MNASQSHINTVMNIVGRHAAVPALADDNPIHRSWLRCYNDYGLNPSSRHRMQVESSGKLRERREQHARYLRTARAGMEQLYAQVADLDYVLMLADADGIALDFLGAQAADSPIRAGLVAGANWHEQRAGTNGIGTCLAERRTLTCHSSDHYYAGNLDLSCAATPLYDPEGELMGVLDLSTVTTTQSRSNQQLISRLTALYGRMIEDANFIRHFGNRWILKMSRNPALVDVNAEAMLAFDADGVIVGANSGARSQLQLTVEGVVRGSLVGHSLAAVFRNRAGDIWRLARGTEADDCGLLETWTDQAYYGTVRGPRRGTASTSTNSTPAVPGNVAELEALADNDPQMSQLISQAKRLASRPFNLLIQGETGTGKEVLAKALHQASPRAAKAFVAINCAALPESLIESELFGYQPGTFTGARSRGMVGLIQRADGGTLFLDEIGDMPLPLQTRLLRVLSEGEVLPLGADKPIPLSLTLIAASHRKLREQIASGQFREDLYYRLSGATLHLPPLRERQDRAYLIRRILRDEAGALGTSDWIAPQALELLLHYRWPGNIRELRNVLRYALSMAETRGIEIADLPAEVRDAAVSAALTVDTTPSTATATAVPDEDQCEASGGEDQHLLSTLRSHHWVISEVARDLNLCRATIYRRMKRYGIVVPTQFC
ncbi:sigma-54-dependent Fis family transcriptional regulator [Nevskia sp.]|uniref:sigma-54-dependent Fis family transcriptional regulator n=1 Tax=Nevskia sp. TaxID=1929292 RepID=UPI0025DBDB53|nr:sigma-54-dependent Fis family transcriptional regulator [Nevskia sp.]